MAANTYTPLASISGQVAVAPDIPLPSCDQGPGGISIPRPDHLAARWRLQRIRDRAEDWLLIELDEIARLLNLMD